LGHERVPHDGDQDCPRRNAPGRSHRDRHAEHREAQPVGEVAGDREQQQRQKQPVEDVDQPAPVPIDATLHCR
jgi:hypothetical protein